MSQTDLNQFIDWVKNGEARRSATIEIGDPTNKEHLRIWAYDYDLGVGQSVQSVDEIDLISVAIERQREEVDRLRKLEGMLHESKPSPDSNPNPRENVS